MKNFVVMLAIFMAIGLYGTSGLVFLGTINGKTFFAETNITSWEVARARCEQGGMHLATFQSVAERTMILNASGTVGIPVWWYWIGARDARMVTQFNWDYNNESISNSVMDPIRFRENIQTCVNMHMGISNTVNFDAESCENTYPSICELIHGRS